LLLARALVAVIALIAAKQCERAEKWNDALAHYVSHAAWLEEGALLRDAHASPGSQAA
jgi:hypothetical protein